MIGRGMDKKLKEELFVAFAACWWGIDGRGRSGGSGCSRGALRFCVFVLVLVLVCFVVVLCFAGLICDHKCLGTSFDSLRKP